MKDNCDLRNFDPSTLSATITTSSNHQRGSHNSTVTVDITGLGNNVLSTKDGAKAGRIERFIETMFRHPYIAFASMDYDNGIFTSIKVEFKHRANLKTDSVDPATMIGKLVEQYGDLGHAIISALTTCIKRIVLIDRAEAAVRDADVFVNTMLATFVAQSEEEINFSSRMKELYDELNTKVLEKVVELTSDTDPWTFSNGEFVSPDVQHLVTGNAEDICRDIKEGRLQKRFSIPEPTFDRSSVPWIAAAMQEE